MLLSLVVPCYNEEKNISAFYEKVKEELADIIYKTEIIFVNDGSKDKTLDELKKLCDSVNTNIRIISFSRNFGKEAAMLAGLEKAKGDYVSIIDADLQQNPKYVVKMLNFISENPEYDGVAAYQEDRKDGKVLTGFKNCFYSLINKITDVEFYRSASDFRLFSRQMVESILSMPERCRFSKGIFSWVGFNVYYMPYKVESRHSGKTKWNFWKLSAYAVDGIIAFSDKPLIISSIIGILLFILSILMMLYVVIKTLIFGDPVPGFPTLASLILLLSGVQLLSIGILGQYLSKMYTEIKGRPPYIIKEEIENKKDIL